MDSGESGSDAAVLRIDRVASPWSAARLAETLAGGLAFENVPAGGPPILRLQSAGERSLLLGYFSGTRQDTGAALRVEYAILDLGSEKLVARYTGPPESIAFNASVLRASLHSLDAEVLGSGAGRLPVPSRWTPAPFARPDAPPPGIQLPTGWAVEAVGPLGCPGMPPPAAGLSASPAADFTTALRAGWFRGTMLSAEGGAAACGGSGAGADQGTYERRVDWLGVSYLVLGRFAVVGPDEVLQLEGVARVDLSMPLRALMARWWDTTRR